LMDEVSAFINRLIERIHPWYRVRLDCFGNDSIEMTIGRVPAILRWEPESDEWDLSYPYNDPDGIAFIERVVDIMNGKVRDDAGNMVDPRKPTGGFKLETETRIDPYGVVSKHGYLRPSTGDPSPPVSASDWERSRHPAKIGDQWSGKRIIATCWQTIPRCGSMPMVQLEGETEWRPYYDPPVCRKGGI
jgi:hypothetical protein